MELETIIHRYPCEEIERALVQNFIERNSIDISSHSFLSSYLEGFVPSDGLMTDVSSMKHFSLAELSVDMELLIPEEDRQTNGAFFTPQHIVDFIIETTNPCESASIIDISCGCGAFLLGAIRFFTSRYQKSVSDVVRDNLFGVDLLEYNVRRSKLLIMLLGLTKGEIINETDIRVIQANSLTHTWENNYDVVVGNPPYVKFQDMNEGTRQLLDNRFRTTSFGTYNLYFAFFEIGLSILKRNGVLGYITPNNYFTSLSGESLRQFFHNTRAITRIVDFGSTKVFDVQTYTAITFLNNKENRGIEYSRIKDKQEIKDYLSNCSFTINKYEELSDTKWRLLCNNERSIIKKIEEIGEPIGKLFNIAVGIATLKDEAFFISPYDEDDDYYFCNNKFQNNFKIEKAITRSHVKISSIKTQKDLLDNKHRIIFPYILNNGIATPITETDMEKHYPECYSYLKSVKIELAKRGKGKHTYIPFFSYGRTQGLNRHGVKIYTPTFSQFPRFILDRNKESLFTNGYGIFYREDCAKCNLDLFSSIEPNPITDYDNVDVLLKILNSGLMHFYVSKTSVSIEGGYPCYQKNFIEKFTIPLLSENDINNLRKLKNKKDIDTYLLNLYQINFPAPNLWE